MKRAFLVLTSSEDVLRPARNVSGEGRRRERENRSIEAAEHFRRLYKNASARNFIFVWRVAPTISNAAQMCRSAVQYAGRSVRRVSIPVQFVSIHVQFVSIPVQCVSIDVRLVRLAVQRVESSVRCVSIAVQVVAVVVRRE